MRRKFLSILILIFIFSSAFAEKNKLKQTALWFRYKAEAQLPRDIKMSLEVEDKIFVAPATKTYTVYWRLGVDKQFKNNWSVGGGIYHGYSGTSDVTNPSKLHVPEVRPFIQVGNKQKINSKFSISHRYRTEWRCSRRTNKLFTQKEDGFKNNFRFRYQISLNAIAFKKEDKELSFSLYDEIFINAGKQVQKNVFDQNRLGLAIRYNFNKVVGAEISYFYNTQLKSNGDDIYNRQVLRFTIYNNFNFIKKDKQD